MTSTQLVPLKTKAITRAVPTLQYATGRGAHQASRWPFTTRGVLAVVALVLLRGIARIWLVDACSRRWR